MTSTIRFEPCTDGGPFDEAAWSTDGHYEPSRALLLNLGRAIHYEAGYGHAEVRYLLSTVRWQKGWVGEHPTKYDYLPCDEDGICETDYDDDGNEITLTNVKPCTWGIVKLDERATDESERDR